jgi:hypothetical protein
MHVKCNNIFELCHLTAVRLLFYNKNNERHRKETYHIRSKLLLECHTKYSDNNKINQKIYIGISILNRCKRNHSARLLIIENKHYVSNE